VTCGQLQDRPGGFHSEAAKLYDREVGELPDSDTGPAGERAFMKVIERRLRNGCRDAADDHRPGDAVVRWLNAD
jgi:hypothetical protein